MTDNISLQEDIHSLKSDPKILDREARKFGYERSIDKSPVPVK